MSPHDRVVSLRRDPTEVRRARREVDDFCAGLSSDLRSIAQLLTSELVTNAMAHGTGDVELRLARRPTYLRVGVHDRSGRSPQPRAAQPWSDGGRGLLLVEQLASQWGSEADPPGKLVWFTLRTR